MTSPLRLPLTTRASSLATRKTEALLLLAIFGAAGLGFLLTSLDLAVRYGQPLWAAALPALIPPVLLAILFGGLHLVLRSRRAQMEQLLLPVVALLSAIGLVMIWRLRGDSGVYQQLLRGFLPGAAVIGLFILRPQWVERIRRWTLPISALGLALALATAFFGAVDETGARLALKLGPLPAIQTSEILKLALIIFLAQYIASEAEKAQARGIPVLGWLRLPAARYVAPGLLFVAMATLALVVMSDFGAVLILGGIFVGMLYAGFETRVFATVAAIGLGLTLLVAGVLALTWHIPTVMQLRFIAFVNPWSTAELVVNGQHLGITISQGPGYQIQQALYAIIAGGLSGTGLGFGSPEYIPLAQSDFIFAAILEEMGAVVGFAVLALFAILLFRLLRLAVLLPREQTFERMLLTGIALHLFIQVLIMVGGTLNLLPVTGVTIPFLSEGGVALAINLAEVGIALALARRLEILPA
jgi:cell division protein FtsW (lipid II flippase)